MDRMMRFQRHSLVRSLVLRHNLIRMVQPFRLHSLVRKMALRHSLEHKLNHKRVCFSCY